MPIVLDLNKVIQMNLLISKNAKGLTKMLDPKTFILSMFKCFIQWLL